MTNYVKQTGVMAGKTIFDFEKPKTPPTNFDPSPHKKRPSPFLRKVKVFTHEQSGKT